MHCYSRSRPSCDLCLKKAHTMHAHPAAIGSESGLGSRWRSSCRVRQAIPFVLHTIFTHIYTVSRLRRLMF